MVFGDTPRSKKHLKSLPMEPPTRGDLTLMIMGKRSSRTMSSDTFGTSSPARDTNECLAMPTILTHSTCSKPVPTIFTGLDRIGVKPEAARLTMLRVADIPTPEA